LTKTQIVNEIFGAGTKLTKKDISEVVDVFLDKIKENVHEGQTIRIKGFGSFYRAVRKARRVHSPITREIIDVPGKTILAFKGSKETEEKEGA
jgi:DNA-binding protein HU-beta